MSYGQGYGDWQQYAGFDKSNPYGGSSGMGVQPNAPQGSAVPPSMPKPDTAMPETDYSIPMPSGMGAAPSLNQGFALPVVKEPSLMDSVHQYYGVPNGR
jgi:hypothetical protein